MLNQQLNDYYLESMGIVKWNEKTLTLPQFTIETHTGVLTLVARFTGTTAELQKKLWNNIAFALEKISTQVQPISYFDLLSGAVIEGSFLIFGVDTLQDLNFESATMTYSLAELIAQPMLKAEVWDVLTAKIND